MSLARYRHVLALPGVGRLLLLGVLARIPLTAISVGLTLHVVGTLHRGYAEAGLLGTVSTIGLAFSGPWLGRMIDRVGLRRTLVPCVVVSGLSWGVSPFLPYEALLVTSLVGGLFGLPIFTVVRQSLAVLAPVEQRRSAYALDSIGTELSFMVGPAAIVLVTTGFSSTVALLCIAVTLVAAGIGLLVVNPPTRTAGAEADPAGETPRTGRRIALPSWATPQLLVILGATSAALVVLGGTDVGVVAHLRHDGAVQLTGLIFIMWSIGSIVGGLVYGAVKRPLPPLVLLLALGLLTIPVGLAPNPAVLALTILPAGALCAPVISASSEVVSRLVPERVRGQAMGWHGSSMTLGMAIGAPLSGASIDTIGPWAGFAAVGLVGAVMALVGLGVQRATGHRDDAPQWVEPGADADGGIEAGIEAGTGSATRGDCVTPA
jgi:MFS family permease